MYDIPFPQFSILLTVTCVKSVLKPQCHWRRGASSLLILASTSLWDTQVLSIHAYISFIRVSTSTNTQRNSHAEVDNQSSISHYPSKHEAADIQNSSHMKQTISTFLIFQVIHFSPLSVLSKVWRSVATRNAKYVLAVSLITLNLLQVPT